jgi:glycine cleavage system H protein
MAFLIFILFIIIVLVMNFLFRKSPKVNLIKDEQLDTAPTPVEIKRRLNELIIPENIFFGKGHTWVEIRRSGNVRLGVDDFVTKILNGIENISVNAINKQVKKGDELFSIETGNKKLIFFAPVSGTIYSINDNLLSNPQLIKNDPYEQGWVCTIVPANLSLELKILKIADESKKWIKEESTKLKEFLHPAGNDIALEGGTLLDGGEPMDGVLDQFGEDVWEKFQKEFLAD